MTAKQLLAIAKIKEEPDSSDGVVDSRDLNEYQLFTIYREIKSKVGERASQQYTRLVLGEDILPVDNFIRLLYEFEKNEWTYRQSTKETTDKSRRLKNKFLEKMFGR